MHNLQNLQNLQIYTISKLLKTVYLNIIYWFTVKYIPCDLAVTFLWYDRGDFAIKL